MSPQYASDRSSSGRNVSIVYELVADTDSEGGDGPLEEDSKDTWCQCSNLELIFDSTYFQVPMGLIIMANAVTIGLETDFPHMFNWGVIENSFLFIFTMELCTKIAVIGPRRFFYVLGGDFEWNVLDSIVVSIGVVDFLSHMGQGEHHSEANKSDEKKHSFSTLLRIMRLLRLVRIFRLFRFLKKLYLLTVGLTEAIRSTFWVTILQGLILYTCSIALSRLLGHTPEDEPGHEFLKEKFGTVGLSMMSLFEITASPDLTRYQEVLFTYPLLLVFLVLWVVFGSFGMIAMLTGVISESMFEKNQARIEELRAEHEEKRTLIRKWCIEEFEQVPKNSLGEASIDDLRPLLPRLEELCQKLEVEYEKEDVDSLPQFMDEDESGYVTLPEFTHGVLSIAEGSEPVSLQEVKHILTNTRVTCDKGHALLSKVMERLDIIEKEMRVLSCHPAASLSGKSCEPQAEASVEPSVVVTPAKLQREALESADTRESTSNTNLGTFPPSRSDVLPASLEQKELDTIWASCEDFAPRLMAIATSVEGAVTGFEHFKQQLWVTTKSKSEGGWASQTSVTTDTCLPQREMAECTRDSSMDYTFQMQRAAVPGSRNFEFELTRVMDVVRSEALATVEASISAERAHVVELTDQLRRFLCHQAGRAVEAPEPDPEGNGPDTGGLGLRSSMIVPPLNTIGN